jgi:glycosyltransferase involved in cell wall biosynthesis
VKARIPLFSATGAIAATSFIKDRLINVYCFPPAYSYCVPNGLPPLDVTFAGIDIHKRYGIPSNAKVIVSTGRANRYKGVDFALKVIKLVVAKYGNRVHYLYCGDGPHLEEFKTLKRTLGIQAHVTFAGRVEDVAAVLQHCDIAFHPSQGEVGYSLSILEYMQAELPLVVSNNPSVCGATHDGQTGYLYEENQVEAAADALIRLLSNEVLRKQMGKRARKEVEQVYSLQNAHAQLDEAMRDQIHFYRKAKH